MSSPPPPLPLPPPPPVPLPLPPPSTLPPPSSQERIQLLARRLQSLTNNNGKEYMTELNTYTKQLSIIRTWPRPPADFPLDEDEGVVWVALIPILYFLLIIGILGALVSYVWYSQRCKGEKTNHNNNNGGGRGTSFNSVSQLNNSINNNNNNGIKNIDNNHLIIIHNNNKDGDDDNDNDNGVDNNSDNNSVFSRSVSRTSKNNRIIKSLLRASMESRGSSRSVNVCKNNIDNSKNRTTTTISTTTNNNTNDKNSNAGSPFSTTGNQTCGETRKCQGQGEMEGQDRGDPRMPSGSRYPINLSIASQSFYSNDGDDDFDDSCDNGERFSRDSLRTSMESQKLLATGVVEIAPDDLYSMSDNNAYATNDDDGDDEYDDDNINNILFKRHPVRRSTKSSHYEICQTSGVENPSFQIESDATDDESEKLFLEDPMGYLVDHGKNREDHQQNGSDGGDGGGYGHGNVINTSSVSAATHFQTSSLFGQRNSNSESFTSTSSLSSPIPEHSRNNNTNGIIINNVNALSGRNNKTAKTVLGNNNNNDINSIPHHSRLHHDETTNKLIRTNFLGPGVGVGGALPPLPPSQYPRSQQEAPGGPQLRPGLRHSGYSYARRVDAPLVFDTSSLLDESNESGNLSLPSSIARFHASRVQPRPTAQDGFPLAGASTSQPIVDADWSPAARATSDTSSMCPNRGSFSLSQSFDELKFKTSRLMLDVESSENEENNDKNSDGVKGDSKNGEGGIGSHFNDEDEDYLGRENETCGFVKCTETKDKEPANVNFIGKEREKTGTMPSREVIKSDVNPRMKRMMSLDWLKSGRNSIEKRLKDFGYVKPKGKKTYVEREDLA